MNIKTHSTQSHQVSATATVDGVRPQTEQKPAIDERQRQHAEIKKVAQDFESLFLNLVMKAMRQATPKSGLIDGGNAENIYQSMLDQEYTKSMAAQGKTGLAETIERQLLDMGGFSQGAGPSITTLNDRVKDQNVQSMGMDAYQNAALQPLQPTTFGGK